MRVGEVNLSSGSGFLKDYREGKERCLPFLDYAFLDREKYKQRAAELLSRSFHREQLAEYFTEVHAQLSYHEEAAQQIEKLKQANSLVVVGGQQAGLLTGPLFTVYKAMSVLLIAKQQEKELGLPVVPVFWIAGEDHDLDEIRYVYIEKNKKWKKHMLDDGGAANSASKLRLEQKQLRQWLRTVVASLPETAYTKTLLGKLEGFLEEGITYVSFFQKVMNWFFGHEGLLLLDAHDPLLRRLEIPYFERLIEEVEDVQAAQKRGAQAFAEAGYGTPVVTEAENAHLFLEVNGERKRLDYQDESFVVRGSKLRFSKRELRELLQQEPERFSNNVVTRPLMQEWLLPVLAFVSGPGELLYWATLKEVFHHFDWKVPPVIPRYQGTIVPSAVQKWLDQFDYEIEPFLSGGMEQIRETWLAEQNPYPVHEVAQQVREQMLSYHRPLRALAEEMDVTLAALGEKNALIIEDQLKFLEKRMAHFVRQQHEHMLEKFAEAERWLFPLQHPQERVFHPILFVNLLGIEEFRRLLSTNVTLDMRHKLFYL
ncbi:bacillithiol biosynthesis cysteine-adding enzyme BshC [Alkalihalobacillus oceani]|uniref:bacillithiol biosynthesis cysteine-adding enzyme BshC n=1 Tax=Halalkalibacter oceani TaxID=1653776 RepID=UPI00204027A8|nr:bacillithiol biosynthesis cysteine-adding enzyme BshC [Halalkalibacter oceani]MCM3759340.1 bacillithiol biosynthesis cysteine-adding enzyme BshC [Halalkalibacter oceani]